MSEGNHDLIHDFPEHKETIARLKVSNGHFARLFAEYHDVQKQIHRIEAQVETPSDVVTEELKKRRLSLKDELYTMLAKG